MNILGLAALLLSVLGVKLYYGLVVRTTLLNLVGTSESTIRTTLKLLFLNQGNNLGFLIKLALCGHFDFIEFMPKDPSILEPVIKTVKKLGFPRDIEERLYNFSKLQESEVGRKFLIDADVNFARMGWDPRQFTLKNVKEILSKIREYSPSQINYLDVSALSYLLDYSTNQRFSFFGNLFPIMSFVRSSADPQTLELWLDQIKVCVAENDLLFYRLAFLSWYYRGYVKFADSAQELLTRTASSSDFRKSVLAFYSQKEGLENWDPLFLTSPNLSLENAPQAQATLYFEHFWGAFQTKCTVQSSDLIELFQTFDPSWVSPFLCRELLGCIKYREFVSTLKVASSAWKKVYYTCRGKFSYFPMTFLPASVQLSLWRHRVLRVKDFPKHNKRPLIFWNHPSLWERHIGSNYNKVKDKISLEIDGFTLLDCSFSQGEIRVFLYGRIIEALFEGRPLPKFLPLIWQHDFIDKNKYEDFEEKDLVGKFCIDNQTMKRPMEDITNIAELIEKVFKIWDVPEILFLSPKVDGDDERERWSNNW